MVKAEDISKASKTRVLITTSVIDNGVNFRNIQNVVVSDVSMVKCLQMVGRARIDEENPRVTLYIKRFNDEEISKKLDSIKWRANAYHDFKTSGSGSQTWFVDKYLLNKPIGSHDPKHWIGTDKTGRSMLIINEIADSLVGTQEATYKAILQEMQSDVPGHLSGQKYLEYQLSWFGHVYSPENDLTYMRKDSSKNELINFLESYADGRSIFDEDQKQFRLDFTKLHDAIYERREKDLKRIYGITNINDALTEHMMPFFIGTGRETSGKRRSYWLVTRTSNPSDK